MGPVNLEAIQEYDELEERQKFLEEQHDRPSEVQGRIA